MKKQLSVALIFILLLCLVSCNTVSADGLWEDATYRRDMTFGTGAKTVEVEVKVEEKSVTFTLKTDKETLADSLLEHSLVSGEDGPYGLYVKEVNGIVADYDVDGAYWSLYKGGESCMTGVSGVTVSDGEHYELVYSK